MVRPWSWATIDGWEICTRPATRRRRYNALDWDGDGELELVCSGNEIFSYKFIDALADGTPVVDRGMRWGTMSRSAQRDENDEGLTGFVLAAGNFRGSGDVEAIVGPALLLPRAGCRDSPCRRRDDGTESAGVQ